MLQIDQPHLLPQPEAVFYQAFSNQAPVEVPGFRSETESTMNICIKPLLGLVLGLSTCAAGLGQAVPSLQPVSDSVGAAPVNSVLFTRADSVWVVKSLFKQKRAGAGVGLALGGVGIAVTVLLGAQAVNNSISSGVARAFSPSPTAGSSYKDSGEGGFAASGIISLILTTVSAGSMTRNSKKREQLILEQFEQGKPLPKRVLRQLSLDQFILSPKYRDVR